MPEPSAPSNPSASQAAAISAVVAADRSTPEAGPSAASNAEPAAAEAGGLVLTSEQAAAVQAMAAFLEHPTQRAFLLKGYAGTGKTTCIQLLIRKHAGKRKVVLTAPTNKAARVLREVSSRHAGRQLDCTTIHRLLGLVVEPNTSDGSLMTVEAGDSSKPGWKLRRYDLVILDECSMVGRDLWAKVQARITNADHGIKLICMGDPGQLPPVNEPASPTFGISPSATLTKPVRQATGNPLGELILEIRPADPPENTPEVQLWSRPDKYNAERTEGYWLYQDQDAWRDTMLKAFSSAKFKADADYARVLAWRNDRVNEMNSLIRTHLLGPDAPAMQAGDRLITREPVFDPGGSRAVLLATSEEGEVVSIREGQHCGAEVFWVKLRPVDQSYTVDVPVLTAGARVRYQAEVERLLGLAKSAKPNQSKGAWGRYWQYRQRWAELAQAYALTVHKSQGSTFGSVFVDDRDIQWNRNRAESAQCRYVALSRASQRAFVLV